MLQERIRPIRGTSDFLDPQARELGELFKIKPLEIIPQYVRLVHWGFVERNLQGEIVQFSDLPPFLLQRMSACAAILHYELSIQPVVQMSSRKVTKHPFVAGLVMSKRDQDHFAGRRYLPEQHRIFAEYYHYLVESIRAYQKYYINTSPPV